ncbi:MAG: cation:proton antiporter [Clostridium sp.]
MAFSLAIIIILGLIFNIIFEKVKLPGLLGMLLLGILIGPYVLDFIDPELLNISADLRKIALIIILLRAGLGIKKDTLKNVGASALKMSCIPGIFEGIAIMIASTYLLDISLIEGGMIGFIIAAVSPAIVVPQMINFIQSGKGEKKGIPTIILAGASIDDVFAITIFSTFLGFYGGGSFSITSKILGIPISILLGIFLGVIIGLLMMKIFKKYHIRDTKKVLLLVGVAIILTGLEDRFKDIIPIASLLGVMTIGFVLLDKYSRVANRMSEKLNKLWVFAEIILFVLVGAEVNISVIMHAGAIGILIVIVGLIFRSIGVYISLMGSNLNLKEKLFCIVSYIPKATVQAAMGAVPLAAGVESGEIILAIAVLSIIITAPLGALGIKYAGEIWLE